MFSALLVDDDAVLRQAMARCFRQRGFECELAANGAHAQQLLADRRFDVVVTDLRMPEVNGHRLAVEILKKPQPPVVIVVTGIAEQQIEDDLRSHGVDEFCYKPADYAALATRAEAILERRVEERAAARRSTTIAPPEIASSSIATETSSDATAAPSTTTPPVNLTVATALPEAGAPIDPIPNQPRQTNSGPPADSTRMHASRAQRQDGIIPRKSHDSATWQSVVIFAAGVSLGWILAVGSRLLFLR